MSEPVACSMVDADTINDETPSAMTIQTRLQRILARYCVTHTAESYIQPNMFKCFLEHLFPSEMQLNPRNTVFYTTLCKRFTIKAKTTSACVGDKSPSKHETVGGTAYRNLAFCPFPMEDRVPPGEYISILKAPQGQYFDVV